MDANVVKERKQVRQVSERVVGFDNDAFQLFEGKDETIETCKLSSQILTRTEEMGSSCSQKRELSGRTRREPQWRERAYRAGKARLAPEAQHLVSVCPSSSVDLAKVVSFSLATCCRSGRVEEVLTSIHSPVRALPLIVHHFLPPTSSIVLGSISNAVVRSSAARSTL